MSTRKGRGKATTSAAAAATQAGIVKQEVGSGRIRVEEEGSNEVYEPPAPDRKIPAVLLRIQCQVVSESENGMELEFDLIGVKAAFANAIRRVLLAEVPSMAIEKVYLYQNTSVIPDEVLCHRFGLLPIKANPADFDFPQPVGPLSDEEREQLNDNVEEEPQGEPHLNLIFELNVRCEKKKGAPAHVPKEEWHKHYDHATVLSGTMKWCPIGNQAAAYGTGGKVAAKKQQEPPAMVSNEIILAKLRPRMEIEARCHCVKGVGRDHAKFNPVATAYYRLMPVIELKREVKGEAAKLLSKSFSPGVIGIDTKSGVAFVENARLDSDSRNVFRHADLKDAVALSKLKDHFIFTVESVGAQRADKLLVEAIELIQEKINKLHGELEQMLAGTL